MALREFTGSSVPAERAVPSIASIVHTWFVVNSPTLDPAPTPAACSPLAMRQVSALPVAE
jgi:hypothetical protein